MSSPRTPGQRAGLTHARVVAVANEVLAERGLDGLSMRAVATRLGVAPNALYSHVANKTALVDDLLDDVLADVEEPDAARTEPLTGLERIMTSAYHVLLGHADLVPQYLARHGARGPNAQRLGAVMLALLESAGLTGPPAVEARSVLIVYTIGFAALATQSDVEPDTDRMPTDQQLFANFTTGLRWLLAGITNTPRPS